jgi:hypothetical protein
MGETAIPAEQLVRKERQVIIGREPANAQNGGHAEYAALRAARIACTVLGETGNSSLLYTAPQDQQKPKSESPRS